MTDPTNPTRPNKAHQQLYQGLTEKGLYTKSYEDFTVQFSNPKAQKELYGGLVSEGLYTKSADDFYAQFFDVKKKKKPNCLHNQSRRQFRKRFLRFLPQIQFRRRQSRVEIRILLQ